MSGAVGQPGAAICPKFLYVAPVRKVRAKTCPRGAPCPSEKARDPAPVDRALAETGAPPDGACRFSVPRTARVARKPLLRCIDTWRIGRPRQRPETCVIGRVRVRRTFCTGSRGADNGRGGGGHAPTRRDCTRIRAVLTCEAIVAAASARAHRGGLAMSRGPRRETSTAPFVMHTP